MGAKYLYADSDPFPFDYDFLATLRGFLQCAAGCLVATGEVDRLRDLQQEKSDAVAHEIEHLDAFESQVVQMIDRMAQAGGAVGEAARQLSATATRLVHEAKATQKAELGRLDGQASAELESARSVIRQAVGKFFTDHHFDFNKSRFRVALEDGGYVMRAVCQSPANVEIAYRLDVARSEGWSHPRKVADIVGTEMDLQVGMKKKFLARDLTREIVRIDDYYVSSADIDAEHAEVHLRKKPDQSADAFVLTMERSEDGTEMEIIRPTHEDSSPFPAVPDDAQKLQRLWNALARASAETLEHRQAVDWVKIDGKDLVEQDLVALMIDRYVDLYAPIVQEISNRSASQKELSLKRELANGRREEVYLKKEELAELLSSLDEDRLRLFARLEVFPTVSLDVD